MTLLSGERTRTVGLCKINAKPASWWHRFVDIVPYWQGGKPVFVLSITALTDLDHPLNFVYGIEVPNRDRSYSSQEASLGVSGLKKGEKREFVIVGMPLVYTGDSFLVVAEFMNKKVIEPPETVYVFHTTNRSWLFLALIAGLLAGASAALINYLISLIN
jgi:hypothetical protein